MCFVNEQPNSCKIILDGNRKLLPTRRIPHPNRTGSTPALEESLEPCCFSSTGWWWHCWDCAHQHDIGSKCAWFRKKRKHPPKPEIPRKKLCFVPMDLFILAQIMDLFSIIKGSAGWHFKDCPSFLAAKVAGRHLENMSSGSNPIQMAVSCCTVSKPLFLQGEWHYYCWWSPCLLSSMSSQ